MSVASIVCVDGELDVHDTASVAVKAAIERRRELATAKIGVAVGDLEIGDPLGFAKRLCELAEPGAILATDSIRRAVGSDHVFVDLGAISSSGYRDRIHVFELEGRLSRTRTVLALEWAEPDRRVVDSSVMSNEAKRDAEHRETDRRVWGVLAKHHGFVERSFATDYLAAFAIPDDAFRAAVAIIRDLAPVRIGIECGRVSYLGDRWVGTAWMTAHRIRPLHGTQLASTMAAVDAVGAAALADLGLVIEVVEEVTQQGVRDPVSIARLRLA